MDTDRGTTTMSWKRAIPLWILTALLVFCFFNAGLSKFGQQAMWAEKFAGYGYPDWFRVVIGGAEMAAAVALLLPWTATYGGAALAVIMAGASLTHLFNSEGSNAIFTLVFAALLVLVAYARRRQRFGRAGGAGSEPAVAPG